MSTTLTTGMPVVKDFELPITDGTLDLSMPASTNNALIAALEVVPD